jgi:hypothetical protein
LGIVLCQHTAVECAGRAATTSQASNEREALTGTCERGGTAKKLTD